MKCCRLKKELVRHPELSSTLIKTEVKPPLVQVMGSWLLVPRTRWSSEEVFDEIIKPVSMFRFGRLPATLFHPSWGSFWCLRFDFFCSFPFEALICICLFFLLFCFDYGNFRASLLETLMPETLLQVVRKVCCKQPGNFTASSPETLRKLYCF